MHRDLNAAWNLWNVLAAEYARLPRPAYLTQPPVACSKAATNRNQKSHAVALIDKFEGG